MPRLRLKAGPMMGQEINVEDMGKVAKILESGQADYVSGPLSPDLYRFASNGDGNPGAKPKYPTLESWLNQDNAGQYSLAPNLQLGSVGSSWEKLMLERQGLAEGQARDSAASALSGRTQQAYSDLAMSGGLSKGARERIARQSTMDDLVQRNQMQRGFQDQRLGIGAQAQQMNTEAKKFDVGNVLTQKRLEDAAKLGKYGEEMKAWAANKQADATAASGKK